MLTWASVACVCSCWAEHRQILQAPPLPLPSPILDVVIQSDSHLLDFNGRKLSLCQTADEWQAVLGPARVVGYSMRYPIEWNHWEAGNNIRRTMTWDNFGVIATLERGGFVTSVSLELRAPRHVDPTSRQTLPRYHPSRDFPGRLVFDSVHIDRESDAEILVKYRPLPWLRQHPNGGDRRMFDQVTDSGRFLLKAARDFKAAEFFVGTRLIDKHCEPCADYPQKPCIESSR